ncbi:MAG TPA: OmpA family protein [Clostridiales bacterium]|nr:OmpA family protein [Clostridiales bacterium]
MSSKDRFKEEEDDDEEEANWQDSYSDLMTDLLAIFVILFAFAMMSQAIETSRMRAENNQKLIDVSIDALLPEGESMVSSNEGVLPEEESFNNLYEHMKVYIEEEGLTNYLSVTKLGNQEILLRVAASVFFDSGQANIHEKAEPLLEKISEILEKYEDSIQMVRIEGHTDNRPINTREFNSNWELSTSRAVNVLRHLLHTSELQPKKLSAVGYSEFHPISDNSTSAGRAKNRRVDFFIEAAEAIGE